jgi:hypothetical protein
MEDKLSALLGNPQLMQQIMAMAQSLGQSSPAPPPPPPKQEPIPSQLPSMPDIDPAMIGKIMSFAGSTSIDRNQKALLCALEPYLSRGRLEKLEKAMRAAKLAGAVSAILPSGAIPFLTGR